MKLNQAITAIKGIGEETSDALAQMNIVSIKDLLEHFPFRYEDYRLRDITQVKHGDKLTVEGTIQSEPTVMYYSNRRSRLNIKLLVGQHLIQVVFFNQPYLKNKLTLGEYIQVSGKWDQYRRTIQASNLRIGKKLSKEDMSPVYHIRGSVTQKGIRRFIQLAFQQFSHYIEDPLPYEMLVKYKLPSRKDAIRMIHFPNNESEIKQARRRLVYEEFLHFQLKLQVLRKFTRENASGVMIPYDKSKLHQFIEKLPFPLTNAQQRVVREILQDLRSDYRMNRLLQGDVGSGKTIVAAIALFAAITINFQGALMVPTEILAEQHAESLTKLFAPFQIRCELLTSSVKGKKRREILDDLREGKIHIIIGTHALIQDEVQFKNLGLVITDEQHRFGVEQRRILREKGLNPNVLFMTATPIPRTLAITAFGEMDVSMIDEMPAGRKVVKTYWIKEDMLERVLTFIGNEVRKGRQAYVICPLIEESDKLDVQNAIDVHAQLVQYYGNTMNVGLMHGRLPSNEKEEVMRAFSKNDIQILVSTTVVEVGVNVPNATIMLIYDAERFGLAQLHQLRGRVGRGSEQSYCILLADPKTDIGKERMRIMTETNDGFVLSERDLELRGPGDFFGKKQSGAPEFKIGDVVHDYRALETARQDAVQLIQLPQFWQGEEFRLLRENLDLEEIMKEKLD